MEQWKFWEVLTKTSIPANKQKSYQSAMGLLKKEGMNVLEQVVLQKG
jgi:hypothetical protein